METFVRKPSSNECLYMDLNDVGFNMTLRFFLKTDRDPDIRVIEAAFKKTVEDFEGINLKYRNGAWYLSDDICRCEKITGGFDRVEECPITSFDYRKNTVSLSVIETSDKEHYLCFDFFHGAADGMTSLQFIYSFFDILNGKEIKKPDPSFTDLEIVKKTYNSKSIPDIFSTFIPDKMGKREKGVSVKNGNKAFSLLTPNHAFSMAAALSEAIGCAFKKGTTVMIPADIRRYYDSNGKFLCGNMALPIFLKVGKDIDYNTISETIKEKIKTKEPLSKMTASFCNYNHIPSALRRLVIGSFTNAILNSRRYVLGGIVTNMGTADVPRLQSDTMRIIDMAAIVDNLPFCAVTAASVRFEDNVHTVVCRNEAKLGKAASEEFIRLIENSLVKHIKI